MNILWNILAVIGLVILAVLLLALVFAVALCIVYLYCAVKASKKITCPCGLRGYMETCDCEKTDCNECCPLMESDNNG